MEDFVHNYYSVERFKNAYNRLIEPLPDKTQWLEVELNFTVNTPLGKRPAEKPSEGGSGGMNKKDAKMLPIRPIRMQKGKLRKLLRERGD
jgi:hypothetical protein